MRYSYIALNQEHQKLTGSVSAENEAEARDKLHSLGLSIISLSKTDLKEEEEEQEITETPTEEQQKAFVFHVLDQKGNETQGTIEAKNRHTAYYRLASEYNFKIISLCDESIPSDFREEKGKEGLEELHRMAEEEFGTLQKKEEKKEKQKQSITQSEEFIEMKKELVENVEEIVEQAKMVLERFQDDLVGEEVRAIKTKIDHLMRLRLSNNLQYIQDLADELLEQVDVTLRRHAEKNPEEEDREEIEDEEDFSENTVKRSEHVKKSKEHHTLVHIKRISKRMQMLMGGYKQYSKKSRLKKKRKKKKKKKSATVVRIQLMMRSSGKVIRNTKKLILSKNTAVRKRYADQTKEYFQDLKELFFTPSENLVTIEQKIVDREVEEEKAEREWVKLEIFQKTFFLNLFKEIRLFFGWLLAFYVAYFCVAILLIMKWGDTSPIHSFLYQSLQSPFPFLATGCFFLIFLGLTCITRIAKGSPWLSSVFALSTVFFVVLFVANF